MLQRRSNGAPIQKVKSEVPDLSPGIYHIMVSRVIPKLKNPFKLRSDLIPRLIFAFGKRKALDKPRHFFV